MGADLYRKSKNVPILGFERSQKAVDAGYFRDAYNNGSILRQFNLSWWRDIGELQDKEGIISLENIKKFKEMLEANRPLFQLNLDLMTKENQDYFNEGAELLLKFLDKTIEDGDSIDASL